MLAIDIGNTHINVCRFRNGQPVWRDRIDTPTISFDVARALYVDSGAAYSADKPAEPVVISSVVKMVNHFFETALAEAGAPVVHLINPTNDAIMPHRLTTPETTGPDRLLSALAAKHSHPKEAVIIAQAGTALTIDAVDKEGVYLGGFILPGPGMWLDALNTAAELPLFSPDEIVWDVRAPGDCTRAAMLGGAAVGLRGAVKEAVRLLAMATGGAPALIFTGGWGRFLPEILPGEYREDLVLLGLYYFAEKAGFLMESA